MDSILTASSPAARTPLSVDQQLGSAANPSVKPVVFVVDPDPAVRAYLEGLVHAGGWRPVTFASAEEFLARPAEAVPGCLALEVSLPGLSGLELQKHAVREHPHIPTIVFSANEDIPTAVEAMKAGAVEFLIKPIRDAEFLGAVREALERSRFILARKAKKRALQRCYLSLSPRQKQVMALVSCGLLNKQVGQELGISEITVKAHRGQVMQKMQADSFVDLVKMATSLGLTKSTETSSLHRGGGSMLLQDPGRVSLSAAHSY